MEPDREQITQYNKKCPIIDPLVFIINASDQYSVTVLTDQRK